MYSLELERDACYTLIPDSADNMTNVTEALRCIRDGLSRGAGKSVIAWLHYKLGSVGPLLLHGA